MGKWITASLAMAVFLLAPVARAWNSTGHMVSALIAYRQLDDAQRKQLGEILKHHPHYHQLLLEDKPENVSAGEWAFLKAATWPDLVRPPRPGDHFKSPAITRYHHGAWHYIDIPYVLGSGRFAPTTEPTPNAVIELKANLKMLSNVNAKPEDRAVALCWVEHLVGDLHQPLHCVSLYSEKYPHGDRGGNDEAIRTSSGVMALHTFWDDLLGTSDQYGAIEFVADEAQSEADTRTKARIRDHLPIEVWAQESHDAAIALAYLGGHLRSASSRDWYDKKIDADQVPPLPVAYEANATSLARQRIVLAGYRLADVLKTALQPQSMDSSPAVKAP